MKCTRQHSCQALACGVIQRHAVYALVDIRIGAVFYIGISIRPLERLRRHISNVQAALQQGRELLRSKERTIASLLAAGLLPAMVVFDAIDTDCQQEAKDLEALYTHVAIQEGCPIVGYSEGDQGDRSTDLWYARKDRYQWDIDEHARSMAALRDMYRYG